MSRKTDVLIAGNGLAGLMAGYAAAKKGAKVKIVSEGMGNLSISPGCIDVLGYDANGKRLETPWDGFGQLNDEHPYALLGAEKVKGALTEFTSLLSSKGLALTGAQPEDKSGTNILQPTIMGTLKPTWLVQDEPGAIEQLEKAKRVLIISMSGFRDCRPRFIASQLARYPAWQDRIYDTVVLPMPFSDLGRSINALDLAHFLDRAEGRDWLKSRHKGLGKNHDLALLPPMLGAKPDSPIRSSFAADLGCPWIEMLSVPPGVGGLRIRHALVDTLVDMGVEFYENAQIREGITKDGKAHSIRLHASGRDMEHEASTFVVATGGIVGGGILLGEGTATEAVFGTALTVPADVDDWSDPGIFGKHLISSLGMKVDKSLRAQSLDNVYYAGRTLGGYDYAAEKSGHGVACATGWHAGLLAAEQALGGNQ